MKTEVDTAAKRQEKRESRWFDGPAGLLLPPALAPRLTLGEDPEKPIPPAARLKSAKAPFCSASLSLPDGEQPAEPGGAHPILDRGGRDCSAGTRTGTHHFSPGALGSLNTTAGHRFASVAVSREPAAPPRPTRGSAEPTRPASPRRRSAPAPVPRDSGTPPD